MRASQAASRALAPTRTVTTLPRWLPPNEPAPAPAPAPAPPPPAAPLPPFWGLATLIGLRSAPGCCRASWSTRVGARERGMMWIDNLCKGSDCQDGGGAAGRLRVTAVEWTQKAHYTASKTLAFYLHLHIKLSSIAHTLPRYSHTMKGSNTSNKQVLLYRVSKVDEREVQTPHVHTLMALSDVSDQCLNQSVPSLITAFAASCSSVGSGLPPPPPRRCTHCHRTRVRRLLERPACSVACSRRRKGAHLSAAANTYMRHTVTTTLLLLRDCGRWWNAPELLLGMEPLKTTKTRQ